MSELSLSPTRHEDAIRGLFSTLAATVVLLMSQEWATWAFDQHRYWKLLPAIVLAALAVYEANKVWKRAERVLGLTHD